MVERNRRAGWSAERTCGLRLWATRARAPGTNTHSRRRADAQAMLRRPGQPDEPYDLKPDRNTPPRGAPEVRPLVPSDSYRLRCECEERKRTEGQRALPLASASVAVSVSKRRPHATSVPRSAYSSGLWADGEQAGTPGPSDVHRQRVPQGSTLDIGGQGRLLTTAFSGQPEGLVVVPVCQRDRGADDVAEGREGAGREPGDQDEDEQRSSKPRRLGEVFAAELQLDPLMLQLAQGGGDSRANPAAPAIPRSAR